MRSKNVRQALNSWSDGVSLSNAQQGQQRTLDPLALGRVGDPLGDRLGDLGASRRLVVELRQPTALADHLAERPECDALAIRRRASRVPVDRLDEAVDVDQELARQPTLADAARANDRDDAQTLLAARRLEEVLEQTDLLAAADERRLEGLGAVAPATLSDDAQCAPRGNRRLLALELLIAGGFIGDRSTRGTVGRLTNEHAAWLSGTLQAARSVDQIAGDHALVGGAEGDRRLAGEHAGTRLDATAQALDCVDQLERGANRELGVILASRWRPPHRHHSVADELLDRSAVAAHDVASNVEVARQRVADVL